MIRFYVVSQDFEDGAGDAVKAMAAMADRVQARHRAPLSPEGEPDKPVWVHAICWQLVFSHLYERSEPRWLWWRGKQYAIAEHKPSVFWRAWFWLRGWQSALWWR